MSVKIMATFRVVKCCIIYQFRMSELLLRSNEIVDMSALYRYNILIVKKHKNKSRILHAYNKLYICKIQMLNIEFFHVPDAVNPIDIFTPCPISICKTVTRCVQISAVKIRIMTAFAGIMKIIIG